MASPKALEGRPPCYCRGLKRAIVIGADVGMTFSAVSVLEVETCPTHGPGDPRLKHMFRGRKFPTVLGYDIGRNPELRFMTSEDAEPNEACFKYFKLLAAPERISRNFGQGILGPVSSMINDINSWGIADNEVLGSYLGGLLEAVRVECQVRDWSDSSVTASFVLGVPAGFDCDTSTRALDGAQRHGIHRQVTAVRMPEHSAILRTALYSGNLQVYHHLMAGHSIVVADVGGITIDIVLHHFVGRNMGTFPTADDHDSKVKGALLLDLAFENSINAKLPPTFDVGGQQRRQEVIAATMKKWHDTIKPKFHPSTWYLMPSNVGGRTVDLTTAELKDLFDQAVERIVQAIQPLWQRWRGSETPPQLLLLAGGFPQNKYVFEQVSLRFEGETNDPNNPVKVQYLGWNVVAPGASLRDYTSKQLAKLSGIDFGF